MANNTDLSDIIFGDTFMTNIEDFPIPEYTNMKAGVTDSCDRLINGNAVFSPPQQRISTPLMYSVPSPPELKPSVVSTFNQSPPKTMQFDVKMETTSVTSPSRINSPMVCKVEPKIQPQIFTVSRETPKPIAIQSVPKKTVSPTIKKAKTALPQHIKISQRNENLVHISQPGNGNIPVHHKLLISDKNVQPFLLQNGDVKQPFLLQNGDNKQPILLQNGDTKFTPMVLPSHCTSSAVMYTTSPVQGIFQTKCIHMYIQDWYITQVCC